MLVAFVWEVTKEAIYLFLGYATFAALDPALAPRNEHLITPTTEAQVAVCVHQV